MAHSAAKELIGKWREKALAYQKCRELYAARLDWDKSAKAMSNTYKLLAELATSCAEDLDKAMGRIS